MLEIPAKLWLSGTDNGLLPSTKFLLELKLIEWLTLLRPSDTYMRELTNHHWFI